MAYKDAKVYFDGSHYVAIPHTTRPKKLTRAPPPQTLRVTEALQPYRDYEPYREDGDDGGFITLASDDDIPTVPTEAESENGKRNVLPASDTPKEMTYKQIFNEAYKETEGQRRAERTESIYRVMRPFFSDDDKTRTFVRVNMDRKQRNLISRRIRMCRKAAMQDFNYFCTFTYDDKLHTEESFRKRLKQTLGRFHTRSGWMYIGVWERSPVNKRLHFHGIFHIPENTLPGCFMKRNDYNFRKHDRVETVENSYFAERFGRNDMKEIGDKSEVGDALRYIMKYLEKSGERIVYSKGLYQFFISDILDDDVACEIAKGDLYNSKKLVLFDDFACFDEGVYMGQASPETIARLRKVN